MKRPLLSALKRLVRTVIGLAISGAIAKHQNDANFMMIAPAINAAAKYARDKWGLKWLPM
mgnify:CR=1 FL=1